MTTSGAQLSDAEFESLMAALGPFESAPWIAVGLSGGSDSLALACLLRAWVTPRAGRVTALIVDHGLRPESQREARAVGRQAKELGLEPVVLSWRGAKPATNVQAEARAARYDLMRDWCARKGVLHLALGHQQDDQAETLLLNLSRGSGLDGLSAMAPLVETPALRLLRPLLSVPRARLRARLAADSLDWIEDPSNRDPRFGRVRLRAALDDLAGAGLAEQRLADAAGNLGRARAAIEVAVARLLARAADLRDDGSLRLDVESLAAAPEEVSLRALARVLTTVGGSDYPPRFERLEALHRRLLDQGFSGATLGGCRLGPGREARILVTREAAKAAKIALKPGTKGRWDGRFRYRLGRSGKAGRSLEVAPLGAAGWRALGLEEAKPAASIRAALPAFRDSAGLMAVPQLGFYRDSEAKTLIKKCVFAPRRPLTSAEFTVA